MKKSLKRLFAMLLCLSLIMGMTPVIGMAGAESEDTHTAHGTHEGWTPVSADDGIPASGGTVYLAQDISLTSSVSLTGDLHLCLNGHTINATVGNAIEVGSDATLTICDCDAQSKGAIDCTNAGETSLRGVVMVSGGTLKLYGGKLKGHTITGQNGGGVYVGSGSFYMYGGEVSGNTVKTSGKYGGGVCINGANSYFEMHGGTICNNTGDRGAGLWVHSNAVAVVHDGTIINNTTTTYGSAIYVQGTGQLTIKDIELSGNICSGTASNSSAIRSSGSLTIEGGTFNFNGACQNGIIAESTLNISGGSFTGTEPAGNLIKATGSCSISGDVQIGEKGLLVSGTGSISNLTEGANITSFSQLEVADDTVEELYTESTGVYQYAYKAPTPEDVQTHTKHDATWAAFTQTSGDVTADGKYYLTDTLALTDRLNIKANVTLCLNGKTLTGMATGFNIVVSAGKTLTLCDCAGTGVVQGNAGAEKQLFYLKGTMKLYGGKITGNEIAKDGAVMQVDPTGVFEMYGGEITGNKTTGAGAVVYNNAGKIVIEGGEIWGNTAEGHAGVILTRNYNEDLGEVIISGGKIYNNKAIEAGVVSVKGSTVTISGGEFYGNTVTKSGSVIYAAGASAVVTVSGGTFTENISQASSKPSTFRIDPEATFEMSGGVIRDNKDANGKASLAVYLVGGAFYKISGTAQIDTGSMCLLNYSGESPSGTIGALEKGASVYADSPLVVLNDGTVSSATDTATGLRYYTWFKPTYEGISIEAEGSAIANNKLKVAESTIGSDQQLTAVFDKAATMEYSFEWFTSDEAVATVDANGLVTFKGYGSAKITVEVRDAQGNPTDYYNFITVQVGEDSLRVLLIGNSFGRDSVYYLGQLGLLTDNRIQASYLYQGGATIRDHAFNLANAVDYTYYKTNLQTGKLDTGKKSTITAALLDEEWDIVVLQHGANEPGWPGTYNSDVKYLIDYIQGEEPNAEVYWNMAWALQSDFRGSAGYGGDFVSYYGGNQATMYNAIIDCLDQFILGDDAVYAERIAGWFPTGMALQELRATYGDKLTRDGYHLSYEAGRMTAAMTLLKTLVPDADLDKITVEALEGILEEHDMYGDTSVSNIADPYINNEANLSKVKAAVLAACQTAKEGKLPEKLDAPETKDNPEEGIIEILQATAPLKNHFPDLVVLKDGTIITCAYNNVAHYPNPETGMQEGVGKLFVFTGSADAQNWTYNDPLLVIDEEWMEQKGIVELSDRYERLKNDPNADYFVMIDPRDPNLGLVYTDLDEDGKEDEVLLFTFWVRRLRDDGNYTGGQSGYLMHSLDGGKTWSEPQEIRTLNGPMIKRGNIAAFNDGQILVPHYGNHKAGSILLDWNNQTKTWETVHNEWIPNTSADEYEELSEFSLVSPDGETVYALARYTGAVLISKDRGLTWEEIANEPGRIAQPSFTLLDENHIFTLWSRADNPRHIYGKVFYIDGSWTDSVTNPIYISPNKDRHDMGDPSAAVLADGRILSIFYDDEFRAIYGVIDDVNTDEWQAIELQDHEKSVIFSQENVDLTENVVLENTIQGSYTVEAEAVFTSADSDVSIATNAGTVTVTPAKVVCGEEAALALALNTKTYIRVSVVGTDAYIKVWQGNSEPAQWTLIGGGTASEKVTVSGDVQLDKLTVSRKLVITMQETLAGVAGLVSNDLTEYLVYPYAVGEAVYSSSNPGVAAVDAETGIVSFVSAGTAVITLTVDGVSAKCEVTVEKSPAELTGDGRTVTLLDDDFEEDKYTAGDNALWYDYWDDPEGSFYQFRNTLPNRDSLTETTNFHIVQEEDGNQYLQLKGKDSWVMTNLDYTGDSTLQFDFKFSQTGDWEIVNVTQWQRSNGSIGNQVHAFVNLKAEGYRINYRPERLDVDSDTITNPNRYYPGTQHDQRGYDGLEWCTFKMTRVNGGMYVKVWNRDLQEPEAWTTVLTLDTLHTDVISNVRLSFSGRDGTLAIDNLKITQQVETAVEESPIAATRTDIGNSLSMQFAVPKAAQSDWTGFYAQVDHTRSDGSVKTTKIPYADWYQDTASPDYLVISYSGVAAKEMTDEVKVTIFDADGKQVGGAYTDSIRDYIMRNFGKFGAKVDRLFADMLNYGAEAQKYFNNKENDLANALMNETQKGYATQTDPAVTNTATAGIQARLDLQYKIALQIAIPEQYKNQTITYSFTNQKGVASGEITAPVEVDKGVYLITVDAIVVGDARQTVTVKANGEDIFHDSVESYIARMSNTSDMADLCKAIMKFADAARDYFN